MEWFQTSNLIQSRQIQNKENITVMHSSVVSKHLNIKYTMYIFIIYELRRCLAPIFASLQTLLNVIAV